MLRRQVGALALAVGVAAVLASAGSANETAAGQRIAITVSASVDEGGLFELIPLTAGKLKHDGGTVALAANLKATVIHGGLKGVPVTAVVTMKSKRGTLKLSQKIHSVVLSSGYSSDKGTWTISGGTGAYAGVTGSGSLAAVAFPGGSGLVNQQNEGYVRTS